VCGKADGAVEILDVMKGDNQWLTGL
jgi:hypothetical protein